MQGVTRGDELRLRQGLDHKFHQLKQQADAFVAHWERIEEFYEARRIALRDLLVEPAVLVERRSASAAVNRAEEHISRRPAATARGSG